MLHSPSRKSLDLAGTNDNDNLAGINDNEDAPSYCPSTSVQDRDPFLATRGINGKHPFCKVAMSFFALVMLHIMLALSFKLAQQKPSGNYLFSSPALLVIAEATKLLISFYLLSQEECCRTANADGDDDGDSGRTPEIQVVTRVCPAQERLRSEVSWPLLQVTGLLAALYCINNNLTFLVFQIADGANINLIKSSSSFVSAMMLHFVLGRAISRTQWSAIGLQICGLVVAQFGTSCSDTPVLPGSAYLLLLASLLISSTCGVWNDSMLKGSGASMHTINILLYAFGFLMNGATYIYCADPSKRFFSGFDQATTYPVLICQSLFGITISAVYKYSDATIKTLTLSCATSILMLINVVVFGSPFTLVAAMGGLTVFIATHLYVSNPPSASLKVAKAEACTNTSDDEST